MKYSQTYKLLKKAELNLSAPFGKKVQNQPEPILFFGMPKQRLKWKLKGLSGKALSTKYKEIARNYIRNLKSSGFPTMDPNSKLWKWLGQPIPSFKSIQEL